MPDYTREGVRPLQAPRVIACPSGLGLFSLILLNINISNWVALSQHFICSGGSYHVCLPCLHFGSCDLGICQYTFVFGKVLCYEFSPLSLLFRLEVHHDLSSSLGLPQHSDLPWLVRSSREPGPHPLFSSYTYG